jgi:hypothetical protein
MMDFFLRAIAPPRRFAACRFGEYLRDDHRVGCKGKAGCVNGVTIAGTEIKIKRHNILFGALNKGGCHEIMMAMSHAWRHSLHGRGLWLGLSSSSRLFWPPLRIHTVYYYSAQYNKARLAAKKEAIFWREIFGQYFCPSSKY